MSANPVGWAGSDRGPKRGSAAAAVEMVEVASVDDEPAFYTMLEAALILRIGRTTAYRLAQRYLATGGAEGLPVLEIGGQLRVPRTALEAYAGGPVRLPSRRAG